jgi:hypothetical protein
MIDSDNPGAHAMKKSVKTPHAPHVGAPDPELKTSPILDEEDEELLSLDRELEEAACFFNGTRYADGQHVMSGDGLLCCERGVWVRKAERSR